MLDDVLLQAFHEKKKYKTNKNTLKVKYMNK